MIVEGTAVYLGKDVAGDWVPVISFRYKYTPVSSYEDIGFRCVVSDSALK